MKQSNTYNLECVGVASAVCGRLKSLADESQAAVLMRFFRTGPGEYGEGDCFLGVKVPQTRALVKEFKKSVSLEDVRILLESRWHEVRLAGFLFLVELYGRSKKASDEEDMAMIVDYYLSALDRGNNWDLVDLVAPKILGEWLSSHPQERSLLDSLAAMDGKLWHQRVSIVCTWTLIRDGYFDDTFRVVRTLMGHPHDLIHKACGWMLREVGKRGGMDRLLDFLDCHATTMPRTMLRYAIEKFPENKRQHYLHLR